jgi:hypothetical protein
MHTQRLWLFEKMHRYQRPPPLPVLQKAKMKDMTQQLDEMNSELSKLRMDNNSLKNRNSILEKVLTLRDEHIRVLQDEQQVWQLRGGQRSCLQVPLVGTGGTYDLPAGSMVASHVLTGPTPSPSSLL